MKYYDVIIFIEHIVRELESAVLIANELKNRGLSVVIKSTFYDYYDVLRNYNCNILIVPWCYNKKDYLLFANINCSKIINLHHEQIGTLNDTDLIPKDKAKDTYHVSWGESFTRQLIDAGINEEKIFQIGSIRNDFYNEKFKKMSKSKDELASLYNLDKDKKWILFAGNFPKFYFLNNDEKNNDEISEIGVKTYYEIIDWLDLISREYVNTYQIIYRPHPTESKDNKIDNIIKENSNFKFIREENIKDWVLNSDVVLSWRSTSAIDSMIASKKTILLRPIHLDEKFEMPILKDIPQVINYEEFKYLIDHEINYSKQLMEEISDRYDNNDGSAYVRLCDKIINLMDKKEELNLDKKEKFTGKDIIYIKSKDIIKQNITIFNKINLFMRFENFSHEVITNEKIKNIEILINEII